MTAFTFTPVELPAGSATLRAEVRDFLAHELAGRSALERAHSWAAFDAEFSRKLGARGWIGMTWPRQYGGHERSAIERYVVLEELLAAGAPVGAHWIADRQSGPLLLRYGTEEQRRRYLPAIVRGELYFCIGMSEPNAGSDLAAVKTRAVRADDGWRITGQKIWTTHAQHAHVMIALVRTESPAAAAAGERPNRHAGLSQFLIEVSAPGVTVRPIVDLTGDAHFNEVFLDDVHVGDQMLIGRAGEGWTQVTSELALERSGPERYLSSFRLFFELLHAAGSEPSAPVRSAIGRMSAELWTLRQMSLSVAGQLAAGQDPGLEAAIVKDLGNTFEQALPR
ncbi:MAG TPA: acyl-CoA dehydrogenase family protein, partial [Burkholderiaceae bacterium]|nr:acyl-CoA dehydrogenase family protein [Burkholderiaceae bacterium]